MTFALSSHATWKVSPGSGRGTLSTSTGAECTYTAGSVTGTATVTATLKDGTSNSIKSTSPKRWILSAQIRMWTFPMNISM